MNRRAIAPPLVVVSALAVFLVASVAVQVRGVVAQQRSSSLPVISPDEAADYVGEFVVVEGRIVQVEWGRRATFLNYRPYRPGNRDFYLVIVGRDRERFDRRTVESWEGKTLRVTGRVQLYRGRPQIRLTRPEQVSVVEPERPGFHTPPRASSRDHPRPPPGHIAITFLGAARTVGGSCILIDTDTSRLVLDIGALYEAQAGQDPFAFGFDPKTVDAVILSHAHLDHVGRLPHLIAAGFRGKVYATELTRQISLFMLRQQLRFQDDRRLRQVTPSDVAAPFVAYGYKEPFLVAEGVTCTFLDAGHLPGSAVTVLDIETQDGTLRIAYTGDYGNGYHPFLKQPELVDRADVVIVEATYGGEHRDIPPDPYSGFVQQLGEQIRARRRVIIPSFVLDRTQKLLWAIGLARQRRYLSPDVPVYLTSGTAAQITELYEQWWRQRTRFGAYLLGKWLRQSDPWLGVRYRRVRFDNRSGLTAPPRPSITIASSADGRHAASHDLIRALADDPTTAFFVVGYAPPHTPTGQLAAIALGRQPRVLRMDNRRIPVRAVVRKYSVFSSHADQDQITAFVTRCRERRHVFVVHGEEESCLSLVERLRRELPGSVQVDAPRQGQRIVVPVKQPAAVR